jgi:hypothetical protein
LGSAKYDPKTNAPRQLPGLRYNKYMGGMRRRLMVAMAAGLLSAAGCFAGQASPVGTIHESPLQDLRSLDELRQAFNRDAGKTRLVLLLSPT